MSNPIIHQVRKPVLSFLVVVLGCAETREPPEPVTDPVVELDASPTSESASPDPEIAPTKVATTPKLPDFSSILDVATLKRTFYAYLHPMVVSENHHIQAQRLQLKTLIGLQQEHTLSASQHAWLVELATEYRLGLDDNLDAQQLDRLLQRVDIVPPALALAQAAIESGWGRSRFARLGNNIYGEWCFKPGCGIVPKDRMAGAVHEISDFDSPAGSIRSYMRNLNTHNAYSGWRDLRLSQRISGTPLSAHTLATGLTAYSELREEYVTRVQTVIRQNAHLLPTPAAKRQSSR
jgi:Bax protein